MSVSRPVSRSVLLAAYACFLVSGAAGLVYEVTWMRSVGLIFGSTVYAITTVLAAFMSGIALGAYVVGRLADRRTNLLRLYGGLEIGIGLSCLVVPVLISHLQPIHVYLFRAVGDSPMALNLCRFVLVLLVLIVPTTLMGATFPVVTRFFVQRLDVVGARVSTLYALNTLGAVVGTTAAGFYLLPALGTSATTRLAVAVNVLIGLIAVGLDRLVPVVQRETASAAQAPDSGEGARLPVHVVKLLLLGIALSGAASMIYEVAWTRAVGLVIGSSTYAFTTMLATFLIGIALGSFVYGRLFSKKTVHPSLFGGIEIAVGVIALAMIPIFDRLPELFLYLFVKGEATYGRALGIQFALSFLVMLIPTTLIGATFPCVVQLSSARLSSLGSDVGRIYSVNTLGTIVGSVLGGFVLIPLLGARSTLITASLLNVAIGAAVIASSTAAGAWARRLGAVGVAAAVLIAAAVPGWNKKAMGRGVAVYANQYDEKSGLDRFRRQAEFTELLYFREGINATVAVERNLRYMTLRIGGKADASNGADMATQLMSGYLGGLLHPDPKRAAVIGLGSGVTVGALLQMPVEHVDLIEFEPAVVEAARFFAKENRNALDDPRVEVSETDGRIFIAAAREPFDLITSEPSNPWIAGIANLFTRDFYELCLERLAPGGIMVQWVQGYSLFTDDLRMVVRTFREVFPHATVWWTLPGDYLLVGSREPLAVDMALVGRRMAESPALAHDLRKMGVELPEEVFAFLMLGEADAATFSQGARVNSDDHQRLEFSAPLALYAAEAKGENHSALTRARTGFTLPTRNIDPAVFSSGRFWLGLARSYWFRMDWKSARDVLRRTPDTALADPSVRMRRAKLALIVGAPEDAAADFEVLLRQGHSDPSVASYLRASRAVARDQAFDDMRLPAPDEGGDVALHDKAGQYYNLMGIKLEEPALFELAIEEFEAALALEPDAAEVVNNLGNVYFEKGMFEQALAAYDRTLELRPALPQTHFNRGLVLENLGRRPDAAAAYVRALQLDPSWDLPRHNLERLDRAASGR